MAAHMENLDDGYMVWFEQYTATPTPSRVLGGS